jgi:hypothetical protein
LPLDAAALVQRALSDESLTNSQRAAIMRPLVRAIYPVVTPDSLRVSAHQMRGAGESRPTSFVPRSNRFCGGCEIVLRLDCDLPVAILSYRLVRLEPARDKSQRATLRPLYETKLRIESASPFPDFRGRGVEFEG